jgi:hypothetical protein
MREFPDTKFVLHHNHDQLKIPKLPNVEVVVYPDALTSPQKKEDESDISDGRGMDQQVVIPQTRAERRRAEKELKKKAK